MLFNPNRKLRLSKVFSGLYALLHEVLRAQCGSRSVDLGAMPVGLWDAVQENNPTKQSLADLCAAVDALKDTEKLELWFSIKSAPSACDLIRNSSLGIPTPPSDLVGPLKKCVTHLFDCTSSLLDVEKSCSESVYDFCAQYAADYSKGGNGNICSVCGTEELAQRRLSVANGKQWRASIDHLLAESKYPLIALDPSNLLPVCGTCNSKAKNAHDLLHDKDHGTRRVCFDPWLEGAECFVDISVDMSALLPEVSMLWKTTCPVVTEKLKTWDAVYQIGSRVRGRFSSLPVVLLRDLNTSNAADFKRSISESVRRCAVVQRADPYNYWRKLLYGALMHRSNQELEQIRAACNATLKASPSDYGAIFEM